ncbi:MAG: MFS transporter [Actinomycetes bacterium]
MTATTDLQLASSSAPAPPPAPALTPSPARPTAPGAPPPGGGLRAISTPALLVVLAGAFLSMADFFIVNVALSDIGTRLQASPATLELVVAGYGVVYALLLVVGGRLGDRLGRKRLFVVGMAAFTLTSLACGLAPSAGALVAARVLQGASAALMVPQVLATIQATTTGSHRLRAMALFGATGGLASVVGQLVGGALVSADIAGTGWRPIFLVNVPIGVTALLLALRVVPDSRSLRPSPVDWPGTALLGATVLSLLVPLSEGRALGWPTWSWLLLGTAPAFLAGFVLVERRREQTGQMALVPPSLVAMPSMARGLLLAVPFFVGFGGFMFVYALAVQGQLGWSPVTAGAALTPMAGAFLVASLLTSRLLARWGRTVLTGGLVIQAVGYAVLIATVASRWPSELRPVDLTAGMLVAGFGQGLVMSPLFGLVLSQVPVDLAGVGSGVMSTTQQTALAVGATAIGTLFLTLARADDAGRAAFLVVLAIQGTVAVGGAALSRLLPQHGRA